MQNLQFVMFWPFLLLFVCHFNSVCHSVCHLFLSLQFCLFFFVASILSVISIVIFLDHFLVTWVLACRFGYIFFAHCKDDFSRSIIIFCRCSNKPFLLFPYSWQKRHQKIKKMTILQVAKYCIFWHYFFLAISLPFVINFWYFSIFVRKPQPKKRKDNNIFTIWQKETKSDNTWQFCRLQKMSYMSRNIVISLSFFCRFSNKFWYFCFFFERVVPKWRTLEKTPTMPQEKCNFLQPAYLQFFWLSFFGTWFL